MVKKQRSGAYPLVALPEAIGSAQKIFDNLGQGPHTRENVARGLGYASFSGAASPKIGALVHFGLLLRQKGGYLVSPLALEIFDYPKEGSETAIAKAASQPGLYDKLINRFNRQALPKNLPHILTADYKITEKAAPMAAEIFIKTMEFSGFLKEGKLVAPGQSNASEPILQAENGSGKENRYSGGKEIKIELPSGIRISFPESLAYRLSMGEFSDEIKNLEKKTSDKR